MIRSILSRAVIILFLCSVTTGFTSLAAPERAAALPSPAFAAGAASCNKGFFGLRPWYGFMPNSEIGVPKQGDTPADKCGIRCFNIFVQSAPNECGETGSDVPGVVLAVIDSLLRIAGLVAVGFIFVGSFQYVASRGNAERTAQAQSTVMNALIGLAVSLVSVGLIAFLGNRLG